MPPSHKYALPESVVNWTYWLMRYFYIRTTWVLYRMMTFFGASRALQEAPKSLLTVPKSSKDLFLSHPDLPKDLRKTFKTLPQRPKGLPRAP